jgi:hypothetical protein
MDDIIQKHIESYENRVRVNDMSKKQLKEKAQEEIMDKISQVGYAISESGDHTEEEKEILLAEVKKQMDRIAKLFGYDEAWFS